jgi:hypothetical protein
LELSGEQVSELKQSLEEERRLRSTTHVTAEKVT